MRIGSKKEEEMGQRKWVERRKRKEEERGIQKHC